MNTPFIHPGGLFLVAATGQDALHLALDLRSIAPRDRGPLATGFLRDCVAAAGSLPARRLIGIAQAAIHAMRMPTVGEVIDVPIIPPHSRLGAVERVAVAESLCGSLGARGYKVSVAGLLIWASAPGLDPVALAAARTLLHRWATSVDTRVLANDPRLAILVTHPESR